MNQSTSLQASLAAVADAPASDRLAAAIEVLGNRSPDRLAIVTDAGSVGRTQTDYRTLAAGLERVTRQLDGIKPTGVVTRARRVDSLITIAAACGRLHVPLALVGDDARDLIGSLHDWLVIDDRLVATTDGPRRTDPDLAQANVIVATSGTSGPPKLVERSWDALVAAARLAEQWHGLAWLLVYDSTRWAGIQVWLQAMLTGGTLVVPASREPDCVARAMADDKVAVLPATPTLLRRLVASADRALLRAARPERITLGGEAVDALLLKQLDVSFPGVRVSHVYATTELGEVFRVTDGRSGFPAEWVGKTLPGGGRLAVRRDGELLVQLSRDTAQVATGDLVERRGDRYEFTGRRSDVIVVGGAKVVPRRVEEVLRSVDGVADARVWGMPSAITGELVAAEIVLVDPLREGTTPESVRAAGLAACRAQCEAAAVPRLLDIVRRITTNPAGKATRRPAGTP